MTPTFKLDTSQMRTALAQYMARSRHSVAFVINRKLFHIARRAYDGTPIAQRSRILETFNLTQSERTVAKGRFAGRIRRATNYSGLNKSAFAIMNWQRRKKGLPALRGAQALRAAKNMVASRLRAVGSLKSGWIGAIIRLRNLLGESVALETKVRVRRAGTARPARENMKNMFGEIEYRLVEHKKGGEVIDPRVVAALQKAFNEEAKDTMEHLAKELQKEANKVNAGHI